MGTRALVLSGGGPVGIAWQTGLAAGLASKDVCLAEADFIVGTSAGSAVGARLALKRDPAEAMERYRNARPRGTPTAASSGPPRTERLRELMRLMAEAASDKGPLEARLAAIGRFALESETMPEEQFVSGYAHLGSEEWPAHFVCTAVDASSGAFVIWDRDAGVPLDRAVASSCAVPGIFPPITIDGRRYIDGGMRSVTNADLAKGHDRVLVVTVRVRPRFAAGTEVDPRLARYMQRIDNELKVLTESGATVELVAPDEAAAAVMGINLMDGTRTGAIADAGLLQGGQLAAQLANFWS